MITPREAHQARVTPPLTPDRWRAVKAVVQEALERAPAERGAYLDEACRGDAALRAEAESLLAAADGAGAFLEVPAVVAPGLSGGRVPDEAPFPARLAEALAERYVLRRELGGGGMSRVFLAEERGLGREVVIKVLSPGVAPALSIERFEREVRVAARLQQANIVPVLSAGEADGLPWYAMPYVRGESLRARLATGAPLHVAEATAILRDVARALAFAHGEGIVHRDIKPENILLSGAAAVVTDFGIAKAISAASGGSRGGSSGASRTDDATLTSVGTSLGTPAYMAPEQVAGERDVSASVDVYAFGLVAWELLAGEHPFAHHRSRMELMAAHLAEEAPSLAARRPGIAPRLASLVMRCLAKAPAARPADGAALLAALDAAESGDASSHGSAASAASASWDADAPSVAVLPFANLSADADNEYFSDGITEEVLNALGRVHGLRVAARSSSFAFKGAGTDLRTMAERLGVRAVLEGSVRRAGSTVRIAVQLVHAADGLTIWSERYDRELADIFALQDEIAREIAHALAGALSGAPGAMTSARGPRGTVNPDAFELYLRGRHLLEQRAEGMAEALGCFEHAARLDPAFSAPHAGTGLAFAMFGIYQALPPREAFPAARAAAERALALDPADALALVVRGHAALWFEWDAASGEALARRALALAPGLYLAHDCLGWTLAAQGRFEEAVAAMQRARVLDPLSDYATYDLGWILILAGRWEQAIRELAPAVARHPRSSELRRVLGFALFHAGHHAEALAELQAAMELDPSNRWRPANLAQVLAALGRDTEARALVREMEARIAHEPLPAVGLAIAHHWLGDDAAALTWLERSLAARDFWLVMLRQDPSMSGLRGDPRFEAVLARVAPGERAGRGGETRG